jgi:hypothetical protein
MSAREGLKFALYVQLLDFLKYFLLVIMYIFINKQIVHFRNLFVVLSIFSLPTKHNDS